MQFDQKLPREVKKGFDGSKRPWITFPHMHSMMGVARTIEERLPVRIPRAKACLGKDEFPGKTAGLEVGVVIAFSQPDADGGTS